MAEVLGAAASVEAAREEIDRGHARFAAGMTAGDSHGLLSLMTDDIRLMPPLHGEVHGHHAAQMYFTHFFSQVRIVEIHETHRDVMISGDLANEIVHFAWTTAPAAGGAPRKDDGHYVSIWRRQPDASWKMAVSIWNSSLAPHQ